MEKLIKIARTEHKPKKWVCSKCGYAREPCVLIDPKGRMLMYRVRLCPWVEDYSAEWMPGGD